MENKDSSDGCKRRKIIKCLLDVSVVITEQLKKRKNPYFSSKQLKNLSEMSAESEKKTWTLICKRRKLINEKRRAKDGH